MITMYSHPLDDWGNEMFLIPAKTLLGQIENFPTKEGLDAEWEVHGPQLIENIPGHVPSIDSLSYFVSGIRYLLPQVVHLDGRPKIVIRDRSPRRYQRESKEEHEESDSHYDEITSSLVTLANPTCALY
jgi:hypothetical protein